MTRIEAESIIRDCERNNIYANIEKNLDQETILWFEINKMYGYNIYALDDGESWLVTKPNMMPW